MQNIPKTGLEAISPKLWCPSMKEQSKLVVKLYSASVSADEST